MRGGASHGQQHQQAGPARQFDNAPRDRSHSPSVVRADDNRLLRRSHPQLSWPSKGISRGISEQRTELAAHLIGALAMKRVFEAASVRIEAQADRETVGSGHLLLNPDPSRDSCRGLWINGHPRRLVLARSSRGRRLC